MTQRADVRVVEGGGPGAQAATLFPGALPGPARGIWAGGLIIGFRERTAPPAEGDFLGTSIGRIAGGGLRLLVPPDRRVLRLTRSAATPPLRHRPKSAYARL